MALEAARLPGGIGRAGLPPEEVPSVGPAGRGDPGPGGHGNSAVHPDTGREPGRHGPGAGTGRIPGPRGEHIPAGVGDLRGAAGTSPRGGVRRHLLGPGRTATLEPAEPGRRGLRRIAGGPEAGRRGTSSRGGLHRGAGPVFCFKTIIPEAQEHLLAASGR